MVPDADNKFDYYVSKELVKYKDGVRQLVFVDEMPLAGWEHPYKCEGYEKRRIPAQPR